MSSQLKDLAKYMAYNYPIEILKLDDNDGGGYIAEIPFLGKDAFTGHGETVEEALISLNEIKEFLFEDYLKNGIEIPPPPKDENYSGKFVVRVPKYLHRALSDKAKTDGVSLNTLCVSLLSQGYGVDDIKKYFETMCIEMRGIKSKIEQYAFSEDLIEPFPRNVAYFPSKDLKNAS